MKKRTTLIISILLIVCIWRLYYIVKHDIGQNKKIGEQTAITCDNLSIAKGKKDAYNDLLSIIEMRKAYCMQQSKIFYYESEEDRFYKFVECTVRK